MLRRNSKKIQAAKEQPTERRAQAIGGFLLLAAVTSGRIPLPLSTAFQCPRRRQRSPRNKSAFAEKRVSVSPGSVPDAGNKTHDKTIQKALFAAISN